MNKARPMWQVRPEQPSEITAIFDLNSAVFPTIAEAELVDRLRAGGRLTVSLLAENQGEVVGHIALSPVSTAEGALGLGIGPLAVAESQRRQGIGAALVKAALKQGIVLGYGCYVVLGDPAYYGRFGFRPAREFGLSDTYGGGDAFQVWTPPHVSQAIPGGVVNYSPEFADLS